MKEIVDQRKESASTKRQRRLCCATFPNRALAPRAERHCEYRGAATEVIGEIFHGANSMVAATAIHSR